MKNKILKTSVAFSILAGTIGYAAPFTEVSASVNTSVTVDQQAILANIISSHLVKDGNHLKINDSEALNNKLKTSATGLSLTDIEDYVTNFNNIIDGKEGREKKEDLLTYLDEVSKQSELSNDKSTMYAARKKVDPCKVLSVVGYAHTTAAGAAALALGVSGPVGWGVVAGMGAAYTIGGLYC